MFMLLIFLVFCVVLCSYFDCLRSMSCVSTVDSVSGLSMSYVPDVAFVSRLSMSYVPDVAFVSGLSILYFPLGFI